MNGIHRIWDRQGIHANANNRRHNRGVESGIPKSTATNAPVTIPNWNNAPIEPRCSNGAISERYKGTTTDPSPVDSPMRNLARNSIETLRPQYNKAMPIT